MDYDNNRAFCVAPWMHAHVAADGNRKLCCMADQAPSQYAKLPWAEFKNSDYMKDIRTQMLSGVTPKECHVCLNPIKKETYKDSLNNDYKHQISSIIESSAEDGSTNFPVKYLDYRSNLCNMKCRTCSPQSSSAYQSFVNTKEELVGKKLFGDSYLKKSADVEQLYSAQYVHELFDLGAGDDVDRLYFAGGEPVIEPNHLPFLESLIAKNKAQNLSLIYNTNLNYPPEKLQKWLALLRSFKSCFILVSTDGHGEICEYIREGLSFEKHNDNIDILISGASTNTRIEIDITLTALNLFFLEDFADYVISKKLTAVAKLMFRSERNFPMLQTEAIPEKQKQELIQRWRNYYAALSEDNKALLKNLDQTIEFFSHKTQWGSENLQDRLHRLHLFESMYPNRNKFIDLLKRDSIGSSWAQSFSS